MKKAKIIFIAVFFLLLILPVAALNTEKDAVSEIDNRVLAENPFSVWRHEKESGQPLDVNGAVSNYVSDRIGFRNEMILGYTKLFDLVFGEMQHPTYTYGKDGYVFLKPVENVDYTEFHQAYVDMMVQIQQYCDDRNVPCYFLFNPAKTTVLQDYLPDGYWYDRGWADEVLANMQAAGVRVVDNTELLTTLSQNGVAVFNKQYDAGHWNDYGAYYGINHLLATMQADGLNVTQNDISQFTVSQETQTTLLVSNFPINEFTPVIDINNEQLIDHTAVYTGEVKRHSSYRHFAYFSNPQKESAPKLMMFQGSYINGKGNKFLANAFSEYIGIHDYQNTMNFDYYFNIFKPDVVVVEVAEYALTQNYFDLDAMKNMQLNPALDLQQISDETDTEINGIIVEQGQALTKVKLTEIALERCVAKGLLGDAMQVWLKVGDAVFDMQPSAIKGVAYECTVDNGISINDDVEIAISDGVKTVLFHIEQIKNQLQREVITDGVIEEAHRFVLVSSLQGNLFSGAQIQLYNPRTNGYSNVALKEQPDSGQVELKTYLHTGESGTYSLLLKGSANLKDEYVEYRCYLEQDQTYYYSYYVEAILPNMITISDFYFGK